MGNYRFRISDMMPNAWFYKLKDMGSRGGKKQGLSPTKRRGYPPRGGAAPATPKPFPSPSPSPLHRQAFLPSRGSYHFSSRAEAEKFGKFSHSPIHPKASDTHLPIDPPRKSKRRSRRKPMKSPPAATKFVTSSVSAAGCRCRGWKAEAFPDFSSAAAALDGLPDHWNKYIESNDEDPYKSIMAAADGFEFAGVAAWPGSCTCRLTSSATDIIIDVGAKNPTSQKLERLEDSDEAPELELRPILTKPAKKEAEPPKCEEAKPESRRSSTTSVIKEQMKSPAKRSPPPGLHRLRMRANSPRLASRRVQTPRARKSFGFSAAAQQRKSLSDSFAVVKASLDPQRDFRDSMVEMIVENNIRASKDLEELLACYLSLNSSEYHDVIVKVFEQIWFDLTDIRL